MSEVREKRDLVLPPRSYAYMQDVTKGVIKTYTGPTVINPTAQEVPVVYDAIGRRFTRLANLEDATRWAPVAAEGSYITLLNPAKANKHPSEGSAQPSDELDIGRKIIIPGPATFALWPEQVAEVVEGHHLRSNQYLLVRVYNEEEARKNWTKAVVKPADGDASVATAPPPDLTVGKQLIIRGTEVSFYIPPTGIEVVAASDDDEDGDRYVREALTLERLEYAILVDENGKKRYEIGPQVVLPLPTERFVETTGDDLHKTTKKFKAVELSGIQGMHIKVIAPYVENGTAYKVGDQLFITGKDTAIYFPREEHSLIKYDGGKVKHTATAIPAGEARYLMNRITGEIATVKGPAMLLPDPRQEVIVRRVLSDRECNMWYPGNAEVLEYNRKARPLGADGQPRAATLDSKWQGAPQISPWTGYAVLVTSKGGERRVERGPQTVLLDYDEGLEVSSLSTGKPKTSDVLLHTPYLRVDNNQVSDILQVETQDHVQVQLHLSYRVTFEGDPLKWFAVENYVKFLCDHIRSVLKGRTRKLRVEDFYATATDHIRDFILGKSTEGSKRPGMLFPENGMRVTDIEVLKVVLEDDKIRGLLDQAQHEVVRSNIEVSSLRRGLEVTKQRETIVREDAEVRAATQIRQDELSRDLAASQLALALATIANTLAETDERKKAMLAEQGIEEVKFSHRLDRVKRERDQEATFYALEQGKKIELLKAEAETAVQRFQAVSGNFSEALVSLSRHDTLVKVAQAWDTQKLVEGESLGDTLSRLFSSTPLKPLVEQLTLLGPTMEGGGPGNGQNAYGRK